MKRAALAALAVAAAAAAPAVQVLWFDLATVVARDALSYEEQLLAYVFEGLVNRRAGAPVLMFDAGPANFDGPGADAYGRGYLAGEGRA